jgi:hypothetical protein
MSLTAKRHGRFAKGRLPTPSAYYQQLAGQPLQGRTWRTVRCPFHDDKHASLSINVENGGYICHACNAKGGDVLAFHMARHGLDFVSAAKELGAWE